MYARHSSNSLRLRTRAPTRCGPRQREVRLALALPARAARRGRPARPRRAAPSSPAPRAERGEEVRRHRARRASTDASSARCSAPRPPGTSAEPCSGTWCGDDVLRRQQAAQLLERALAPHRLVVRVLDRPEGVVGHAEHDREAALARRARRAARRAATKRLEVLDDLEAGDAPSPPCAGERARARAASAVRGRRGRPRPARVSRRASSRRACVERVRVDVDQHARARPASPPSAARGGDAGAAAEVAPQCRAGDQRRGERVAQLVLDPDRRAASRA